MYNLSFPSSPSKSAYVLFVLPSMPLSTNKSHKCSYLDDSCAAQALYSFCSFSAKLRQKYQRKIISLLVFLSLMEIKDNVFLDGTQGAE